MAKLITLTEENYLKALYHLSADGSTVSVNELSKYLDIKMPSVNSMMKKFALKNWVVYESYKPLTFTSNGRREAAQVVRKHRLTEMFLVEKMGFGWEEVHEIAEQLEHISSEKFFDKIDEILEFPKNDPHGSPIPDRFGNIAEQNFLKLSECRPGQNVVLSAIAESSNDFLKFLDDKRLKLGTAIQVIAVEDFDRSMTLAFNGKETVFSALVCDKLLMEKL